ncbi:MAG: anti-sigma factor family protein [Bacteroidota bacterium]
MNKRIDHPDELLPWYVNGTLANGERQDVEAHLQSCERCRQEVAWLQNLRTQVKDDTASSPGELGLHRLLREAKAPRSVARQPRQWWRPALAAAAVLIVIQSAVLINVMNRPAAITPLGGPVAEGVVLQVKFAPDATEAQIRQLLQQVQASLISGPGALGVYRVRLEGVTIAQDQAIQHVINELTGRRDVITYAARE